MNLCVLLLLLTTTTTGSHFGTKVNRFLAIFGFGKPKETEPQLQPAPVPQEDSSSPNPLPPIRPNPSYEPQPDHRLPRPRNPSIKTEPAPYTESLAAPKQSIQPEQVPQKVPSITDLSSVKIYQPAVSSFPEPSPAPPQASNTIATIQPQLREGFYGKTHYADVTFLGSNKVLVTVEPPTGPPKARHIYFPHKKTSVAIIDPPVKTSNISVVDANITIFTLRNEKVDKTLWFKRLENEDDIPNEGFIYANGMHYPCSIEIKKKNFVKITYQEKPPEGTIKSGTPVIGKTGNDEGPDTLIAMFSMVDNEPSNMAVLTSVIPSEKINGA